MPGIDLAVLVLRVVLGLLFIGHGAQKLLGWFGGHGLEGTAKWFGELGLNPPRLWAVIAGLAELLGGVGLVLGLLTPIAAAAIIAVMLMAIAKVHWANGLWITQNGLEYALVNALVAAFIGFIGPGRYALDAFLRINYPMPTTFLIALVIAIIGILIALVSGRRLAQPQMRSA